ncbi:hypothetical protein HKD37_16G045670 [Glycine soja]
MASPPSSPRPLPPSHPPPPPSNASVLPSAMKQTRKASRLRSLSTRPPGAERPVVHVDFAIGKADGPHRKKLRIYLGIVARDKVDVTYENWKERLLTVGRKGSYFRLSARDGGSLNQTSRGNRPLQPIRTVWTTICEKYSISKEKWAQFCQTHRDPSWEDVRKKAQAIQKQNTAPHVLSREGYEYLKQKLLVEKTKKKLEEAAQSGSIDGVIDPPSPVKRHVKWKMARTKKIGEMTTEATKEIVEKIVSHFQLTIRIIFQYFVNAMYNWVFSVQDSFEEQATQGSFVPHGCLCNISFFVS